MLKQECFACKFVATIVVYKNLATTLPCNYIFPSNTLIMFSIDFRSHQGVILTLSNIGDILANTFVRTL
jgi:hypothetical protein